MDYLIDYTRITNSGRLSDKFLTVQVRRFQEEKIDKGVIFALVEITKPWFPNSQIGQKIINALSREYLKSANTSDLVNFELALKKVNKTLAQITQSGETDWIGNINAVLAVICDKSMHIAQTGKGEAFLVRDGKVVHITEGAKNELKPHPLNTFGDIMSGALKHGDKLMFTSPEILNYVSQEKIRQILANHPPFDAASQIGKIIKNNKIKDINAVILEIVSKDEMSNRTTDQT
ncbi:MAG: hypothetical protein M1338_03800, partial [Patescibacteria group bacterium]|nr:hypothetical protein [Patescibacteria group bacterium]